MKRSNYSDPNRREFLEVVGALMGTIALADPNAVGEELAMKRVGPIGLQLYTVRDEMKKSVPMTLARVARTGYKEVEFAGYFNHTAKEIRDQLKNTGLTAPSAHVGFPELGQSWDKIIDDAHVVGHKYLVSPWIDDKYRTVSGYKQVAELFNKAGEATKKAGIQFAYHNHNFEFPPVDGVVPYDLLLAETDRDKVKMEMDVYWITKAGADPLAYFKKHPGRFPLLHIKDMDATPDKGMVDVGKGVINWRAILGHRSQAGTKHIFVEHDQPKDAYASIRNSYQYLRNLNV